MNKITEQGLDNLRKAANNLQTTAVPDETQRRINKIVDDVRELLNRYGIQSFIKGLMSGAVLGIVATIITLGILRSAAN